MPKQRKIYKKRNICVSCKKYNPHFMAIMQYDEEFAKKHFRNKKTVIQCSNCLKTQSQKIPDYNLKVIKHIEIL